MPTITDELLLDLSQPLRQFDRLDDALSASVGSARRLTDEIGATARSTSKAATEAGEFENRLQDAERSAGRLNTETAAMSLSAGKAEGNIREMATALGISEDHARRMAAEVLEAQAAANKVEDSAKTLARSLGLSDDEARRFAASMGRASTETIQAASAADLLSARFASIRSSVVGLVAGFGAFAAVRGVIRGLDDLVDSFVAFDQAINQSLAIVSGVTPEIRAEFEAVARTVATTLRFSAAEAGEAFFFLASAGFDVQQQLAALPGVAQFAQAGMFDLSTATSLLADSQSALGLRAKDAQTNLRNLTRVADVLTKANILSNAEVQQFAEALTNRAAAAARDVGIELEEVVAVLAAFADQGLKGAAAGEAFAIVIRDLQNAALKEKDAFREFGISVFDAAGEVKPLADIIGDLEQALDSLSDAQRRQALMDLGFQDRSVANLLVLLGTSDAIRDYTTGLQGAAGATRELAENQLKSLGARLDIAKQKFEDAKITLGEELVPAIEAFVNILPGVIEGVRDLAPALERVATAAANAAPAIGDMVAQFLRFLEATPRSAGILVDLGQILGDFGNVGRSLVVGVGASAAALTGSAAAVGQVRNEVDLLGDAFVRIQENVDNVQFGRLEQGLVDSLREGDDAIIALGNHLIALDAGEGGASLSKIAQLARTAGVSGRDLDTVLRSLVARSKELGLNAQQVEVFNQAIRNNSLATLQARTNFREWDQSVTAGVDAIEAGVLRIEASADPLSTFFAEIDGVLEETGLTFAEFVLTMGDTGQAILDALPPADRFQVTLLAMQADAELAAEVFRATLTPSIIGAMDALEDLNKDGSTSLNEFITNLIEGGLAALSFTENIATIALTSTGLAAFLATLPVDIGGPLAQKIIDEQRIAETELARTQPEALAETIRTIIAQGIGLLRTDPDAVEGWLNAVMAGFDGAVPEVRTRVLEAVSTALVEARRGIELHARFSPIDLNDVLIRTQFNLNPATLTTALNDVFIATQFQLNPIDLNTAVQAGAEQVRVDELTGRFDDIFETAIAGIGLDLDPAVQDSVDTIDVAELTRGLDEIFDSAFLGLDLSLFGLGAETRQTWIDGLSTPQSGEASGVRESIKSVMDTALAKKSPSKLFRDYGVESADAYWSGFDEAAVTPTIELPELIIPPVDFTDVGISDAQTYTRGFTEEVRRFEGEFRLSPGFDPLTVEQILSLNLGPATQVFGPGDPLTVRQLEQIAAAAGLTALPVGIQFDFDLQALLAVEAVLMEAGVTSREAFMVGLSTMSHEEIVRLRASIQDALNAALEAGSPSQLMIRIGGAAGIDFIGAFAKAANRPIPVLTGMQIGGATGTSGGGGGSSITVNNQINNPVARDVLSEAARLDQLTGASAASLRAFNAGL